MKKKLKLNKDIITQLPNNDIISIVGGTRTVTYPTCHMLCNICMT
ncbi:MAG: hypothetical protein ACEPOV_14045 [Hyphomicrobiales bacterium]